MAHLMTIFWGRGQGELKLVILVPHIMELPLRLTFIIGPDVYEIDRIYGMVTSTNPFLFPAVAMVLETPI